MLTILGLLTAFTVVSPSIDPLDNGGGSTLATGSNHNETPVETWMQFRGPNGTGISASENRLPDRLDLEKNLVWKTVVPAGHSSPIVVGDSIYLTAFEPGKLIVLCFARENGSERWRREIAVESFERYFQQHGPATPTPVSDGQRVFVVFGSFGILAYDLDGNELWRRELPQQRNTFGSASSPIIADKHLLVFLGSEDESLLQSLNPASGDINWERRRPGPASSWSTPVMFESEGRPAVLIYEPYRLQACLLADGSDLWSVPGLADEPITIPQVGEELIYATSYNLRTNKEAIGLPTFEALLAECDADDDGKINAEEAKSNKSILSRPDADGQGDHPLRIFFRMLDANRDGAIDSTEWPHIHAWMEPWTHANGLLAIKPGDADAAPNMVWQHASGVPECPSPLLFQDRLYEVRNGGVVTCLDAKSGEQLFHDRIAGPGPYYASPIVGDKKIYLASARRRHRLVCQLATQGRIEERSW